MAILIKGGIVVNEGLQYRADIIIEGDRIQKIINEGVAENSNSFDSVIDATDAYVLPGVIDTHVHFREPGLTAKADMESESRAAAFGGVTSVFDMPNTNPQTTTIKALEEKMALADANMHINYALFPGATNDNVAELESIDPTTIPGIKLFMGSSTGNMLIDNNKALDEVFAMAKRKDLVVMAHCEDTEEINRNMQRIKEEQNTDDPDVRFHPIIRSELACVRSSTRAMEIARKHNARLHIAHISTATELSYVKRNETNITLEATVAHLWFCDRDYETFGARIKCNPAIKSSNDRQFLRAALNNPTSQGIYTIATDHAPHILEEKQGGAAKAMSGMPMIQFSLPTMLTYTEGSELSIEQLVAKMCHNPATLFSVSERGFLREGYKADIAIVKRLDTPMIVTKDIIQSKCGWSPLEGQSLKWKVDKTICNGRLIYDNGMFDNNSKGERIKFER